MPQFSDHINPLQILPLSSPVVHNTLNVESTRPSLWSGALPFCCWCLHQRHIYPKIGHPRSELTSKVIHLVTDTIFQMVQMQGYVFLQILQQKWWVCELQDDVDHAVKYNSENPILALYKLFCRTWALRHVKMTGQCYWNGTWHKVHSVTALEILSSVLGQIYCTSQGHSSCLTEPAVHFISLTVSREYESYIKRALI
jgi:hypothetical protein